MVDAPKSANLSPGFRDNYAAPFVYFDATATHGVLNGVIQIELVSRILLPLADGGVQVEFFTTGRLRCTMAAAQGLKNSIDKALGMLSLPQEPAAEANKVN